MPCAIIKEKLAGIIQYITDEQNGPRNDSDILESVKGYLQGLLDGMNIVQQQHETEDTKMIAVHGALSIPVAIRVFRFRVHPR